MTIVACLALGHLCQQRFLFQLALINLGERLARPQNHIDEETANEEDRYQQGRENLCQQVLCAGTDITERPDNQTQPENDNKGHHETNDDT